MKIEIDGKEYTVARVLSDTRAIIDYDGLYVLVDQHPDGTWDLSGEPAHGAEKVALDQLLAPTLDQSILTITPPDDPSS